MTSEQVSCVLFIGILCMFVDIFYRLTLWFIFHIWKLVQRYNADEEDCKYEFSILFYSFHLYYLITIGTILFLEVRFFH